MARWQPNARERLAHAALELFEQRGYDSTSVAEVTERAGLTKSAFFRHFSDKREVLFDGPALSTVLTEAIRAAPQRASPTEALLAAFQSAGRAIFTSERQEFLARRAAVIAQTPELREREALKQLGLVEAMIEALQSRGVPALKARVSAELAALAFTIAYERWLEPGTTTDLTELVHKALNEVRAAGFAD